MTPQQTALFTDLDGTLFNSEGKVSAENRAAIDKYIAAGGMFAIATGREPRNALGFLGQLPTSAPSIVLNGSSVYDFSTGTYGAGWHLDRAKLDPILRRLQTAVPNLDLQLYTKRGILYCTPEALAQPQMLRLHRPCIFTELDAVGEEDVFKCVLFAPPEQEAAMAEILRQAEGDAYRHVLGTTDVGGKITYHELLPTDASKGTALRSLRSHPMLAGRTFFAAGDYWNDYELLREADIAVAPANAIDEIKAICAYTVVSNNDHAIRHILRELMPRL